MFKPKTLLKVVSVIMIIFTAFSIITLIAGYAMLPKMISMGESMGMDMTAVEDAYTPMNLVLSVVSSLSSLVAAILGVSGKSYKGALISMGIYTLILVVSTIQSIVAIGFSATFIISFILPILYWWGLYQSKE